MSHITYSNHFYTKVFTSGLEATPTRGADNPCFGVALDELVPSKYKRLQLLIQNQGTEEVNVSFGDENAKNLKLYAGQSIAFENYNGSISIDEPMSVLIFETFA